MASTIMSAGLVIPLTLVFHINNMTDNVRIM